MGLSQQRPQLPQQKQSDRLFTMSNLTSGIDTAAVSKSGRSLDCTAIGQPGQSKQDRYNTDKGQDIMRRDQQSEHGKPPGR